MPCRRPPMSRRSRRKHFSHVRVSPQHPPGLYGAHEVESALNVLHADDRLSPLAVSGLQDYGNTHARALEPYLLAAAMLLLLLDALLSLWLRGFTPGKLRWAGAAAASVGCASVTPQARADEATNMKAALDTRLAYVKTGLADVDSISQAGLTGLGLVLRARTSYEPMEPMGLDPEQDDLSLYPLLYWPMDPREKNLSPKALSRIGEYMRNGGTILFDTRDLTLGAVRGAGLARRADLAAADRRPGSAAAGAGAGRSCADQDLLYPARLSRPLDRRPAVGGSLPPAPKNGAPPARGGDGVSPVIIGGNDWAAAWAVDASGHFHIHAFARRRIAARDGVPLRHQSGDVCPDRQLQDRCGACAGLAATAGQDRSA